MDHPSRSFISDSLFDVSDLSVLPVKMWGHNFQNVLQTCEEFCNKNIPVVFTASTNNGGLQGVLTFLTFMTFATYKIDSLTSQWKVFDFFDIYFVEKFDFPEFHLLNFDFFLLSRPEFWLTQKDTFLWNLTTFAFLTKCFWLCFTPFRTPQ